MAKNYKIALYIRVSTEEQAENPEGSIKNQEQRLREAVAYRNRNSNFGEIVGAYVDAGISAKDMNRPRLQDMLRSMRSGEVNLVMVTELSRLSRNNRDFIEMWDLMHKHQCRFMSLREDFDTTTAAGEMLLFQLANFAQFERKQTSERVSANITARASRGLYNGGPIPIGYRIDLDKPGYLFVEEEMADIVKIAYKAFLKEGCLSHAAKWLNENGYRVKRNVEGGGGRKRLGYFTVCSLHQILRNKAYLGIKVYTSKGEAKEAKAVWPPIIDELTFKRAGDILTKNKKRYKPPKEGHHTYLFAGLTSCEKCRDAMPGKSAHGNSGKVTYYEHSWLTKRSSTMSKVVLDCGGKHRVPAKKLEPAVWNEIETILSKPEMLKSVFEKVQKKYEENPDKKEKGRIKAKIYGINSQIEALTERLSQIPKNISAAPIFKQMERLEGSKQELEKALSSTTTSNAEIVPYETFMEFIQLARKWTKESSSPEHKRKIAQKFIQRVAIHDEGAKVHYFVGKDHYERELALVAGSPKLKEKNISSSSLQFGGPTRTRT